MYYRPFGFHSKIAFQGSKLLLCSIPLDPHSERPLSHAPKGEYVHQVRTTDICDCAVLVWKAPAVCCSVPKSSQKTTPLAQSRTAVWQWNAADVLWANNLMPDTFRPHSVRVTHCDRDHLKDHSPHHFAPNATNPFASLKDESCPTIAAEEKSPKFWCQNRARANKHIDIPFAHSTDSEYLS